MGVYIFRTDFCYFPFWLELFRLLALAWDLFLFHLFTLRDIGIFRCLRLLIICCVSMPMPCYHFLVHVAGLWIKTHPSSLSFQFPGVLFHAVWKHRLGCILHYLLLFISVLDWRSQGAEIVRGNFLQTSSLWIMHNSLWLIKSSGKQNPNSWPPPQQSTDSGPTPYKLWTTISEGSNGNQPC